MRVLRINFLLSLFVLFFLFSSGSTVFAESILPWQQSIQVPYVLASQTSFIHQGQLFILGGSAEIGVNKPKPLSAPIDNGNISSTWNDNNTPMPRGLIWHSTAKENDYIYVIGGTENLPGSGTSDKVTLGILSHTGILDPWLEVSPLPKPLSISASIIVSGKLYVSGGFSGSQVNQDIYFATINSDGTLSDWTYANQLPEPRFGHTMIEHNGYLYTIGGRNNINGIYATTFRQKILEDGTLEDAEFLTSLPTGVSRNGVVKIGSKIISVGGDTASGTTDQVFYADILADGTLSEWTTSTNPLPQKYCCGSLASSGDYLYYTGGHDGADYFDTVYTTKLDSSLPPITPSYDLSVNLLKQTSAPWQSMVYDKANLWSPTNPTINRWGCALTSATMVLQYHGFSKLTATTQLDPGTLNTWLNGQIDGYIGNGLLNWLAISRLSKQIKAFNPVFTYDALEYKRINGMDNEQLDNDLAASIPGILAVPGHFVVAKGKNANTYLINDPFYNRLTLSEEYGDTYTALGRFIPSNTDLSYILVVTNEEVNVKLRKKSGSNLGDESLQEPITDPITGNPNGNVLKTIYAAQPTSGDYEIVLSTTGNVPYSLDIYVYDVLGDVKRFNFTGILNNTTYILPLKFDKTTIAGSSMKKIVTFADFYRDIKLAYQSKQINSITYLLLTVSLKDIEKDYTKGKKAQAVKKIDLFKLVITKFSKKDTSDPLKKMLLENLEGLRNYVTG